MMMGIPKVEMDAVVPVFGKLATHAMWNSHLHTAPSVGTGLKIQGRLVMMGILLVVMGAVEVVLLRQVILVMGSFLPPAHRISFARMGSLIP